MQICSFLWVNRCSCMFITSFPSGACFYFLFYFMFMGLPACMFMHHIHAVSMQGRREHIIYHLVGVIDSCELPCGCWELDQGSLQKQPVFLVVS